MSLFVFQGDAPPPLSPVHQNGAALMEQNAGKPLTPEPRLSQVSPFVSSLHPLLHCHSW